MGTILVSKRSRVQGEISEMIFKRACNATLQDERLTFNVRFRPLWGDTRSAVFSMSTDFLTIRGLLRLHESSCSGASRETNACPFVNLPEAHSGRWGQGLTAEKMKNCVWLKPSLVGQFEFVAWTPDGHLRHSKFIALPEDKNARDVVRE